LIEQPVEQPQCNLGSTTEPFGNNSNVQNAVLRQNAGRREDSTFKLFPDAADAGQIVGQGIIDGQEHAFLVTPEGIQVPEPSTLLIFGLTSAAFARLASHANHSPVAA
jgi:hypothetical protein